MPCASVRPRKWPMNKPNVKPKLRLLLLALPLLCAACAQKSTVYKSGIDHMAMENPGLPPALAKPPPSENYLEKAQLRMQSWCKRLLDSETKSSDFNSGAPASALCLEPLPMGASSDR